MGWQAETIAAWLIGAVVGFAVYGIAFWHGFRLGRMYGEADGWKGAAERLSAERLHTHI